MRFSCVNDVKLEIQSLVVLCCRYWYDRKSAAKVDQRIQKGLFMFAVTNSCMNPIVYGAFNIRVRRAAQVSSSRLRQPDTVTTSGVPQSRPACTFLGRPLSRDPFFLDTFLANCSLINCPFHTQLLNGAGTKIQLGVKQTSYFQTANMQF
jgi:hypothetical protein